MQKVLLSISLMFLLGACSGTSQNRAASFAADISLKGTPRLAQMSSSSGPTIYIAQIGQGSQNGSSCANAYGVSWFNQSSSWSGSGGPIGPGVTVHFCGSYSSQTPGDTGLFFQGDGSSTNPITLQFESGAVMSAPYFGGPDSFTGGNDGAVNCINHNYIIIDGGGATIENTDNGTNDGYQSQSAGISSFNCSNIEVRNFTVSNIYVHANHGYDGDGTCGICGEYGSNVSIHDNNVTWARTAIAFGYGASGSTNVEIYNNTVDYHVWAIQLGDADYNSSGSNFYIHDNSVGPHFNEFQDTGDPQCAAYQDCFHADGIFLQTANSGSTLTNSAVYNNFIQWNGCTTSGTNCTGMMFLTVTSNLQVYNNLLIVESGGTEGMMRLEDNSQYAAADSTNVQITNNTFVDTTGNNAAIKSGGGHDYTYANNIYYGVSGAYLSDNSGFAYIGNSNDNVFFIAGSRPNIACDNSFTGNSTCYPTLSSWTNATGFDANSMTSNPQLDNNYVPLPGSPAVGLGANLSISQPASTPAPAPVNNPTPTATPAQVASGSGSGSSSSSGRSPASNNELGCFTDYAAPNRVLTNQLTLSNVTVESCIAAAAAAGYEYAGVEYSGQCFADHAPSSQNSSSNCTMPCQGNSSEMCGGNWAINVYSTGPSAQAPSQSAGAWVECAPENGTCNVPYPTTVEFGAGSSFVTAQVSASIGCNDSVFGDPDYGVLKACYYLQQSSASQPPTTTSGTYSAVSMGCFTDYSNRVLTNQLTLSNVTVESCIAAAAAAGYTYAGVEYSGQCFAGNAPTSQNSSSQCTMPCQGNSSEMCGGNWAINLYSLDYGSQSPPADNTSADTAGSYLGCYADNEGAYDSSQRVLNVSLISSDATVESCVQAAQQAGLKYAGLQYYGQCFGGNSLNNESPSDSSNCSTLCNANSSETCGGFWYNSVYETGN